MRPDSVPDLGAIQIIYLLTYLLITFKDYTWDWSQSKVFLVWPATAAVAVIKISIINHSSPVNDEMLSVSEFAPPPASFNIFNLSRARTRQISYSSMWVQINKLCSVTSSFANKTRCRAIAGRTARCCCKFWHVLKFTATSRHFHCNSNAFELNNSINHGKLTVLNISIDCL